MTTGAGAFGAGLGPAGHDPIVTAEAVARAAPPALRYEGTTQDWALDSLGRFRKVHPVDQGMALGMMVRQGSLKSSPDTGNRLFSIGYLQAKNLRTRVEALVRTANPIARLVADGSATLKAIEISTAGGRLIVACLYSNNVLKTEERAFYES